MRTPNGIISLFLSLTFLAILAAPSSAQRRNVDPDMSSLVAATSAEARLAGFEIRGRLMEQSLVSRVPFRNIGPAVMSGRVVDIDASPDDPSHFYVAYASGGLWKTVNNGQSFTPLFDNEAVMTIGDIAVDWAHGETIWVGTGENNSSRSSYAGSGVYRSTDGGETWTNMGLAETHRTGRIVLHPDNPDVIWVAALGHLYSPGEERGVYKSVDGGETWIRILYVDENTGGVDLVLSGSNPNELYAAMWERGRRAWNFVEGGPGSGIYKTVDGGDTWDHLNVEGSGFPSGEGIGRIGLDLFQGSVGVLYAILDNQNRRPDEEETEEEEDPGLTRDRLREISREEFLGLEAEYVETFLRDERFPEKYDGEGVLDMVRAGKIEPVALVEYLDDANAQLFETSVIGAEVYRSDDGGRTWSRTHDDYLDSVYNSYGYYFGEIRVAPDNVDQIYIMGVPILRSDDGGASFKSVSASNVHADHQALWMNPVRSGHMINGNDGGLNMSYDHGETWSKLNIPPVGQFYSVQVDNAESYNVYGGLQDNGVWMGPHTYRASSAWVGNGDYPYDRLAGGDGMQVEVDTRTNDIVYTGSQFGFYSRIDRETGRRTSLRPRHELGDRPLRFNWQVPIHLSRHNQDILYYGANRLYRSMNRGEDPKPISGDLTHGGQAGDVPYGTLATIDESPLKFGLLYTGSDDGYVFVSRDGGNAWARISDDLPQNRWVSRVEASNHAEGRVYVSLNGYRWDDFGAYVYRSDDYGSTWTRIGTDLPLEPVNVITEDPHNENVLYVGTDHGVYVSLDGGTSFMGMFEDMPAAPVHDIKVQARERDLVVGTHGRSIFVADVALVEQLTSEFLDEPVHLFELDDVPFSSSWGSAFVSWADAIVPETTIAFFSSKTDGAKLTVANEDGDVLKTLEFDALRGLNYLAYDLSVDTGGEPADNGVAYLETGSYTVTITIDGDSSEGTLEITERRSRGMFR